MLKKVELTHDEVEHVYSGRPGCCCGCKGTHYRRGEKGAKGMFTRVINAINAAPEVDDNGDHVFLDLGGRWYVAYRKETE